MKIIHVVNPLPRLVSGALADRLAVMPAVVVTGARQTGKSTLAEQLVAGERSYRTLDDFDVLCAHLATMHPSRYLTLIEGVTAVHITGVHPLDDQSVALRVVSLTDRLYDAGIPVVASGAKLDTLFPAEMLEGGYRKKYLRALSRMTAAAREATPR